MRLHGVLQPSAQVRVLSVVDPIGTDRIGGERKAVVTEHVGERDRRSAEEVEVTGETGGDRAAAHPGTAFRSAPSPACSR